MRLRHVLAACFVSVWVAFGSVAAPSPARAAEAPEETPTTPITRQVLELRRPVGRIFSGTSEAVLAFDEERKEIQFIDAATGEIADAQKIDGVPLYLTSYYLGPNRWEFLYTQRNDAEYPAFSFGILMSRKKEYFTSINNFNFIPDDFRNPVAMYTFSSKESNIVSWDRSLNSSSYNYTTGGFKDRSKVDVKLNPYDIVGFRNDQYVLAIHPRDNSASLLNIREGYPEDFIPIKDLSVADPAHYASFAPDTAYGGRGTVVIANSESELLTVVSVLDGGVPQIDRPLQISLKNFSALAAGNRTVLVAANRNLSAILVGTVGGNQLAVFRKVGEGLEELKPVELAFPIKDIAVLPRRLPNENEVFAFLREDGRALLIEPDVLQLINSVSVPPAPHDPAETAFPISKLDNAATARLQRALTTLGYPVGTIDGILGRATKSAIRAFQFKSGIEITGIFDEKTRAAINEAITKLSPAERSFIFAS